MKYLISLMIMSCLTLTACSDKEAKHEGVLTDSQEKALERAHNVNDTIMKTDEDRLKKLEEETQ